MVTKRSLAGIFLLGLLVSRLIAGEGPDRPRRRDFSGPAGAVPFEVSLSQAFDEEGSPTLAIGISIPYRRLVFFKRDSKFEARYRVLLELRDGDGKYLRGEVWEESVVAADYGQTSAAGSLSNSRRIFRVEPGNYKANVTLEVMETSRSFKRERTVRIVGRSESTIALTDPVFAISSIRAGASKPPWGEIVIHGCESPERDGVRMNPGAVYADFGAWPSLGYSVVGPLPSSGAGSYLVSIRVKDMRGNILLYGRKLIPSGDAGHRYICVDFSIAGFLIGNYDVSSVVELPGTGKSAQSLGTLTVLLSRGMLGYYFTEMIEILSLFAEDEELAELKGSEPAERMQAWMNFWKRRDPTPDSELNEGMIEIFQRLRHVVGAFSRMRPGWETDMGKVYIRFGEPDKIDERQTTSFKDYQLWYYYSRGVVYVFEDSAGSGEYVLVTTRMI